MRKIPAASYKARTRGPFNFSSKKTRREEGNIMTVVHRDVVTAPPSTKIKDAVGLMLKNQIRRLPIVDPGTSHLLGMIKSRDIVDFMGGGDKSKFILIKFHGNLPAAANEPVRSIMAAHPPTGATKMTMVDGIRLLLKTGEGGVAILDERGRVAGVVSERDFIGHMPVKMGAPVSYLMSRHIVTAEPDLQLKEAAKRMISKNFRRLPITRDGMLVGIITTVDLMRYFGSGEIFKHAPSGQLDEAMTEGVDEIMTRDVLTITPETDVVEAAALMVKRGCGGIPVVTDRELKGIITEHDLLRLLI